MDTPLETFHYTGTVGSDEFNANDVTMLAHSVDGQDQPRLLGIAPSIRFWRSKVVLIAAPLSGSSLKWCAFCIGDVIHRTVRPGDRIDVSRNHRDDLTVSLFRAGKLVLAIGALLGADLGPDVQVMSTGSAFPDLRVSIFSGGQDRILRSRESATVGEYDAYVDLIERDRHYGTISIVLTADPVIVNCARRSAVLMSVRFEDGLCGERADGTVIKDRRSIE